MVIYILATLNRLSSTLAWQMNLRGKPIYALTIPTLKEDIEYVNSIKEDVKWLGFEWDNLLFASDYFEEMYKRAVLLINKGLAFVDDLSADEIREYRGTLTAPGKNSPYRERTIEENLDLFARMRAGEFDNGQKVLRAKLICPRQILICVTLLFTGYPMPHIITPAISGAFIQCMPLPIRLKMRLKVSHIPSVPLNSRISVLFIIGWWNNVKWRTRRSKLSLAA